MSLSSHEPFQPVSRESQSQFYRCTLEERGYTVKKRAPGGYVSGPEVKYCPHLIRSFQRDLRGDLQIESLQLPSIFHRYMIPLMVSERGDVDGFQAFWLFVPEGGGLRNRAGV